MVGGRGLNGPFRRVLDHPLRLILGLLRAGLVGEIVLEHVEGVDRLELVGGEGVGIQGCGVREVVHQRVANRSRRLDLGFEIVGGRHRLGGDPQACPFSRGAGLGHRVHQIVDGNLKAVLGGAECLQQAVAAGSQLLDLGPTGLAFTSEVAQHPLADGLGLGHHLATPDPALVDDRLGLAPSLVEHLVASGQRLGPGLVGRVLCLAPGRVGGFSGLVADCLGLTFGPLGPLGGGRVGRFEDLGRLGPQRLGDTMGLQRLAAGPFPLGETARQVVALQPQPADLTRRGLERISHRGRFEAAADHLEVLRLEPRRINGVIG